MTNPYHVAVIGAGSAGLFGARELAAQGVHVSLFNRDIKPGGLAEYGIYPEKHTMKEGLRKQFRHVLDMPNIDYYGNITFGTQGDLTLDGLRSLGFDAVLVTVGAQGTKSLNLPGEELEGVYHAKDVVYYYNHLPPYSQWRFHFGKRCAIIGAGNVMVDIARHLINEYKAEQVTAVVRRGPAEVNFTKEEMKHLISYLDLEEFEREMARVLPALQAINQDPEMGRHKVLDSLAKADPKTDNASFHFDFLASPVGMIGENGKLTHMEVEDNILIEKDGKISAKGTGNKRMIPLDTVIFAIGDKVDESFGLPTEWGEFVKSKEPRFPMDGLSYESPIEGIFVGGWSRKASSGLVGIARKDGTNAAKAVLQYLGTKQAGELIISRVIEKILSLGKPVVLKEHVKKLEAIESEEAKKRGVEEFKFDSNEEMLKAVGLR
ncbi:MAG TPA: FAD-dependent oxidoreductase [Anaerolineales bacterium]|nr:FAD-dependent oxidoreductase [Anaerolineales bacterium]HNQ95865.1 FAD-dependent oxidoreductase [Anaerolineales bacterium]HNS61978.1 FAD-dependent oxidoreductase [Anaerolineales bacterium]